MDEIPSPVTTGVGIACRIDRHDNCPGAWFDGVFSDHVSPCACYCHSGRNVAPYASMIDRRGLPVMNATYTRRNRPRDTWPRHSSSMLCKPIDPTRGDLLDHASCPRFAVFYMLNEYTRCTCQCHDGAPVPEVELYHDTHCAREPHFNRTSICEQDCRCFCHRSKKNPRCGGGDVLNLLGKDEWVEHVDCPGTTAVYLDPGLSVLVSIDHCGCACHAFYVGDACEQGRHGACAGTEITVQPHDPEQHGYDERWVHTTIKRCSCSCHLYAAQAKAASSPLGLSPPDHDAD